VNLRQRAAGSLRHAPGNASSASAAWPDHLALPENAGFARPDSLLGGLPALMEALVRENNEVLAGSSNASPEHRS